MRVANVDNSELAISAMAIIEIANQATPVVAIEHDATGGMIDATGLSHQGHYHCHNKQERYNQFQFHGCKDR